MSITRIIDGSLTKTATGNIEIHATNGDLNLIATKHNNWRGDEDGIIHHNYEAPHPADSLSNTIDIKLNIFFDGTQNNKTNTIKGKEFEKSNKKNDSYLNDFSNVARGYDTIDVTAHNQEAIYIEGIGTENEESDDVFPDVAMGMGDRGVKAKVTKACVEAGKILAQKKYQDKKIDTLIVNVFGFSRGAAAARHFLHVANSSPIVFNTKDKSIIIDAPHSYQGMETEDFRITVPNESIVNKHGYFAACLLKNNINPAKITFNFVGLYDTVASYGLYHGNDVEDLQLNAIEKAYFVFQLSADDEYRENFDLTDITSAGINGLEYSLPGVHCDIGGAYKDKEDETAVLYYKRESVYNRMIHHTDQEIQKFKDIVIKDGWYKEHQITAGVLHDSDLDEEVKKGSVDDSETFYTVVGTRKQLRNTYDKIPFKKMLYYSDQFGVVYNTIKITDNHEIKDSFLQQIYNQLLNYMVACNDLRNEYVREKSTDSNSYLKELRQISYLDYINGIDLKRLRNEYLHWSVKANKFGLDTRQSEAPTKEGALEQQYRKREIHHG